MAKKFFSGQEASTNEHKHKFFQRQWALLQAPIDAGLIIVGLLLVVLLLPRTGGDGWIRYQDFLAILSQYAFFNLRLSEDKRFSCCSLCSLWSI